MTGTLVALTLATTTWGFEGTYNGLYWEYWKQKGEFYLGGELIYIIRPSGRVIEI